MFERGGKTGGLPVDFRDGTSGLAVRAKPAFTQRAIWFELDKLAAAEG
jgi:hypothetical protein